MKMHAVELAQAQDCLFQLAARAHAGEPTLLTRHGQPYVAIVPADVLTGARPRARFTALRGSGKGLWAASPADSVVAMPDGWA
jgi:antitoxin (DNA-binding transcriptional repressor) of toxin-antitoxin stability system